MKKEKRESKSWLMGGLAALTFLSTGSMAVAQTVTSYNDLAWGTGQLEANITKITSPNGGSGLPDSGLLVDSATGNPTSVTLTITGGSFVGDVQAAQGANPTTGSDAFDIFDGNVDGLGVLSYASPVDSSDLVLTFTGMSPEAVYDLTFFSNRADDGWERASLVDLSTGSGGDRVNISSVASDNPVGGVIFSGPLDSTTRLPSDNFNGYVARWNGIKAGSDGMIVLTISHDGAVAGSDLNKGKYGSAIRLVESGGSSGGSTRNDLDGDGKADLMWRNTTNGNVAGWLLDGLSFVGGVVGVAPAEWEIKGVGDTNVDGKADLVWRNTTNGSVAVWLMDGLGAFTGGVVSVVPAEWEIKGVGDTNADGKDDIVWRNTTNGSVAVWLMDGLGAFTGGVVGGAPAEWEIKGVGDTNADGKADLVWRNTTNGSVAVWLMDGLGAFTGGVVSVVPAEWEIKGVGDTNADDKADLVWRNSTNGSVAVWLMDGLGAFTGGVVGGAPAAWEINGVGDTNVDGKADLMWRNTTNGSVAVWLMDGLGAFTGGVIGGAPAAWQIQSQP